MNYIEFFQMLGIDVRQRPCIVNPGNPHMGEGGVGDLYMDSDTGALYKCTGVDPETDGHIWEIIEGASPEQIQAAVNAYLEDHPPQEVLVDSTLSIPGAAADAKATGDRLAAAEKWELINTINITEENTRVAVFDDNFCLKKFVIKAYFAGVSGQTTRNITLSMMEKLDNGQYQVFYNAANLSAIVDNSPRYFTIWGDAIVGVPMMLYMSRVGQYPEVSSVMETVQSPNVANKGLTRFFFNDGTNANLPVGSKFEMWGVRV